MAYSVLEFQAQPAGAPGSSFVWDVANPGRPEAELAPASPLVCLAFNLKVQEPMPAPAVHTASSEQP